MMKLEDDLHQALSEASGHTDELHRSLANFNAERLAACGPRIAWRAWEQHELAMRMREHVFVEEQRTRVDEEARTAPHDPEGFAEWFTALLDIGPGQNDPLFPWLAEQASLEQMCWFLGQEAAGEAGFDDLVALCQVKLPSRVKMELARNYWDEMGRGNIQGMHGGLLERLLTYLGIQASIDATLWPSLALGNLMVALATDRQYVYHGLGALGVIELTAPSRVSLVNEGLRRLDVPAAERRYFELHAALDIKHAHSWILEVLVPLVESDGQLATWLAEGALMRLRAGERCFHAYRKALWEPAIAYAP